MKPQTTPAPIQAPAKSTAENIKDTLESIVVAFILAFIFRAFIVEAFVIPTGSMAVTLYGNQLTNTCSICGYEFARGIEQGQQDYAQQHGNLSLSLECPNCGTTRDKLTNASIANPDSGDRILVHKWPFDIGGQTLGPRRWEVTVFKDPTDGTTNFIKRLVGLPGEVLEIIDGDIYTASLEPTKGHPGLNKVAPDLVKQLDQLRRDVYAWGRTVQPGADTQRRYREEFAPRYAAINQELLKYLRIHRKLLESPRAQESLWVNVYDHDHLPNYGRRRGSERGMHDSKFVGWYAEGDAAAAAWHADPSGLITDRELRFKSNGNDALFLRFDGKPIVDFSAYNDFDRGAACTVGDVRLRFTCFPEQGDGAIIVRMNRDQATFTAEIHADGSAAVLHQHPDLTGGQQEIGRETRLFEPGKVLEVEFMLVDYMVRLIINGRPVIESNDDQYRPDVVRTLAKRNGENHYGVKATEVRIGARALDCRLRHLILERDVYYRDVLQGEPDKYLDPPYKKILRVNAYRYWSGWGTVNMPMLLRDQRQVDGKTQPGEYFMLGDNSPASKDSRLWWEIGPHLVTRGNDYQVGTVPGDQLIGEAFFVYWPAGYRCSWLQSVFAGRIGLIPNFGRMRWIR